MSNTKKFHKRLLTSEHSPVSAELEGLGVSLVSVGEIVTLLLVSDTCRRHVMPRRRTMPEKVSTSKLPKCHGIDHCVSHLSIAVPALCKESDVFIFKPTSQQLFVRSAGAHTHLESNPDKSVKPAESPELHISDTVIKPNDMQMAKVYRN
ncbi:unnamed protein product [Ceratitis capitata]|uniref:(Mediterranean fruit fly) hypothetical protein n=1 Tax=Ceratitis capitata TaxID=7213 RepID=A0A811V2H9_CERCA|nr:unnamed protein product [Ceratitis capitata]